jgi:hypothetical protein
MNDDKVNITPKFENLSYGTLRRYQTYFGLKEDTEGGVKKDKESLLNMIQEHFNNLEVNADNVIETFVSIEKDQNNEKNNNIRKSIRFQEKNMAKFLDSFNTIK